MLWCGHVSHVHVFVCAVCAKSRPLGTVQRGWKLMTTSVSIPFFSHLANWMIHLHVTLPLFLYQLWQYWFGETSWCMTKEEGLETFPVHCPTDIQVLMSSWTRQRRPTLYKQDSRLGAAAFRRWADQPAASAVLSVSVAGGLNVCVKYVQYMYSEVLHAKAAVPVCVF